MQPTPAQNLPDAQQASGLLPQPASPVASGDLSALAATGGPPASNPGALPTTLAADTPTATAVNPPAVDPSTATAVPHDAPAAVATAPPGAD